MKRLILFLVGGMLLGLVGFVLALYVIPSHQDIPDSTIDTDASVTIDVSATPTSALWAIPSMTPGIVTSVEMVVTNNGADNAAVAYTASNTDAVLAGGVKLLFGQGDCLTTSHILEPDGTFSGGSDRLSYLDAVAFSRNLTAGMTDTFCLQLVIPSGADFTAIDGLSNITTMHVDADLAP